MYQVIIVEDDPMVAAIDRQYVEMNPAFQVAKVCRSGGEGLSWFEHHDGDLVILDYYTPNMTGLEFVDRLRAMGRAPDIIMVTSANDTHIVRELLSRGVLDYLVKPFRSARFHQALERFLQSRKMLEREAGSMDQEAIDRLVQRGEGTPVLAKGLNQGTLELIRSFFAQNPGRLFTGEQVAEGVSLSRITVRRYVNFMVDGGEITTSIDYQTGGRPSIRYFLPAVR